ncbi:hypothetical protein ACQKOF_22565 [Lysinibacillus sp. NPDC093190]|uniref:hypothetical protein n=1 Tax=Lysinibacillus sp. NPDC093190 TaxID=3390575 RepID=UPI003D00D2DD
MNKVEDIKKEIERLKNKMENGGELTFSEKYFVQTITFSSGVLMNSMEKGSAFFYNKGVLEDLFPLSEEHDGLIIEGETYEIAGKYYSELDEEVQQMIVSRSILTYTVDMKTTTEEEIEELYYRLNDGCPLTVQQKAKALMGVEWSARFNELGNHRLIHEKAAFSETQL